MKGSLFAGILAALAIAGTAAASSPPVPWSKADMTAAVKALGYPKPHPKTLTCKTVGPAFRCTAIYTRKRIFYTEGQGVGGWICAGPKLATCKILAHGFTRTANLGSAELAAQGYLKNKYGIPVPIVTNPCAQAGTSRWTCGYNQHTITVTMKKAPGGYLVGATST